MAIRSKTAQGSLKWAGKLRSCLSSWSGANRAFAIEKNTRPKKRSNVRRKAVFLPCATSTQPRSSRGCVTRSRRGVFMSVTWTTRSWTSASPQPRLRLLKVSRNSIASSGCLSRCDALPSQVKRPDFFDDTNPALRIDTTVPPATSSTRQKALFAHTLMHLGKTGLACLINCGMRLES